MKAYNVGPEGKVIEVPAHRHEYVDHATKLGCVECRICGQSTSFGMVKAFAPELLIEDATGCDDDIRANFRETAQCQRCGAINPIKCQRCGFGY